MYECRVQYLMCDADFAEELTYQLL
jgi:hypothetical protein